MLKGRLLVSTHCSLRILASQKHGLLDQASAVRRPVLADVGPDEHSRSASMNTGGGTVVFSGAGVSLIVV